MRFTEFLAPSRVLPELRSHEQVGVLHELAGSLAEDVGCPAGTLATLLTARERVSSTAIGEGIAIPHCRVDGAPRITACVAVHPRGVAFGAPDGRPVQLFVALTSPTLKASAHLSVLARIVALLREPHLREAILHASSAATIHALLREAEAAYLARQQTRQDVHWPASTP